MKKTTKLISMILSFLMIISGFNFAFALPNTGYEPLDLQKVLESRERSVEATELFPSSVGKSTVDFNIKNLIGKNIKNSTVNKISVNSGLNTEEKKYVEDVASSLSNPVGAIDINGSPNEYIDIIVWLQELPATLKAAYGNSYMSLTSSYEALGSKARRTIKSKYSTMSINSIASSASSAIRYEYFEVFAGFAMTVSVKEAKEIAEIDGVYAVIPDKLMYANDAVYNPDPNYEFSGMAESREVLNIGEIHEAGIDGEGVIVGVLDTGIDYNHPDLASAYKGGWNYIDPAVDYGRPKALKNSPMETTYEQWQASGGKEEIKNNSSFYTDHGTHVSGTIAAGAKNTQSSETYKALGMAPNVDLYVARVLGPYGSGATSGIIMAIEDFTTGNSERGIPKADVINLSLGADVNTAYDEDIFALNNAVIAGVNVSVSAGNSANPSETGKVADREIKTLGNPGTAYLPLTVAASQYGGETLKVYDSVTASNGTDNRSLGLMLEGKDSSNILTDGRVEGEPSPTYVEGKGYELYLAFVDGSLASEEDKTNYLNKLKALPNDSLEGKILVVERGINFTEYIDQAKRTKAGALIILNNAGGGEDYIAKGNNVNLKDKNLLVFSSYYSTNSKLKELATGGKTVYIELGNFGKEQEKLPAYFSSIGPVNPTVGLKPDIIAPGWDIVSTAPAYITNDDHNTADYSVAYQSMSGTSMSAPHMAGILALMKQRYPEATPAEIKARLMNTSKVRFIKTTDGTSEYETSVYEVGAGFVDPYRAIIEEYGNDVYVTVTDDIPGLNAQSLIENQTLSSLSFGNVVKGVNSKMIPVKVNGTNTFDISVIYNDNTRYSKKSTENEVVLNYSTPVNGEFNVWIESSESTADGYYEGYLIISVDGKEYSMPWLVEFGNAIPPFENLLFTAERPIISTSVDTKIRSAGFDGPNSNNSALWFSWEGTWPTDSYGDTGLDLLLVDPETNEFKYYYGFVDLSSVAYNDGTGIYAINGFISDKARKFEDTGLSEGEETIANGAYKLLVLAGGDAYFYGDVGVVATDGTGDYAVQLDLDSNILVNDDEDVLTASIKGRIFSPALEEAAEAGFIWTPSSAFWNTGKYFEINQSFNVLGSTLGDIYVSGATTYNIFMDASGPWICDEDGYFNLTTNLNQGEKSGGYPFNFNGSHSVVGVEGFFYNEYTNIKNILVGANKSTLVAPKYTVGSSIELVSADYEKIVVNITTGSAITGSAITGSGITAKPTVNSFSAEYSIDGGKTYSKLILTSADLNEEETEIKITYIPIRFTSQQEVIIKLTYLEEEYITDSFDSGVVTVADVLAINDKGLLGVFFDYIPYNVPAASEFTITSEGGLNLNNEDNGVEFISYEDGLSIFHFTPYKPALNQDQNVTFYVEFNGVKTASNTISLTSKHNVTFKLNGGKIENVVDDKGLIKVEVLNGGKLVQPANPTKKDHEFKGWFYFELDENEIPRARLFDFNIPVTSDLKLVAGWGKEYTVTFKLNGGTIADISGDEWSVRHKTIRYVEDDIVIKTDKPSNPTREGYKFLGWYTSVDNKEFNFNEEITSDLTLIAKWNKDPIVEPDPDPVTPPTPSTPPTTPTTPEPVVPVEFGDTTNHWAKDDIGYIAGLGLVNGTSSENFSPDSNMNRGMIVTILGRLAKVDKAKFENSSSFNDVAGGQYYAPFVEWAAQLGLVNGTGNGGFNPEAPLTREQLAHMLVKYAELMKLNLKSTTENKVQFVDEDKVSSYASESVQKARELGIIVGSNGSFDPDRSITRAEVITMLARFIKLIEQQ